MKRNNMRRNLKAQVFVSAVLYLLITAVVMVIILEAGIPVMEKSRDKAVYERQRDQFLNLNQHIKDVASEGQGSKRVIPVQIERGELDIGGNALTWSMATDARIVEPRSYIQFGDLSIISDFDVEATEYNTSYVLENSYVTLNFSRCDTGNNCTSIETMINSIALKDGTPSTSDFDFALENSTFNGTGVSYLLNTGNDIEMATVVYDFALLDYDIHFTLRSKEDFVVIEVIKN